jgi:O-glycosyl hydrolase
VTKSFRPRIKIIDFDADTITKPVSLTTNSLFTSEGTATVTSESSEHYGGPRIFGAFVDSSDEGKWSASDQVHGGLKLHWGKNKGHNGDRMSGLFLFTKDDFLNGVSEEEDVVAMDESSKVNVMMSPVEYGAVSSSSISFVFADSTGYHISSPIAQEMFQAGYPFTFYPKSLEYYDFDPSVNADAVGESERTSVPSFDGISSVGFRIDVKRGVDTFKSVNVGVKLFTVHAVPPPSIMNGTGKKTKITLDGEQTMKGFGATVAFEISCLLNNKHVDDLCNLLFKDLNLDILRIRNHYLASDSDEGGSFEKEIKDTIEVIKLGEKAVGRSLMTLLTSWTAPNSLKNNQAPNGGTIAYDPENIMDYHYQDYGKWWTESVIHYQNLGVYPEYLSIQTEPNNDTDDHPSMKLEPFQQKENGIAGYNMAIEAAVQSMKLNEKIDDLPKFIGPDTLNFDEYQDGSDEACPIDVYIGNLVFTSTIYAWAHHLYYDDLSTSNPDALNDKMGNFASHFSDKPIFITEYYNKDVMNDDADSDSEGRTWERLWHYAKVMHNALTLENASAFFYKNLYGNDDALVSLPDDEHYVVNPEYYAFKHYTAFIEQESIRLVVSTEESGVFISAFASASADKMTLVILNENADAVTLNMDFDSISIISGEIYSSTRKGKKCEKVGNFEPADDRKQFEVDGESITTLYLDYVSPYGVRDSAYHMNFHNDQMTSYSDSGNWHNR